MEDINRLIADFMAISAPIERHLQQDKPLTALQWDLLSQTVKDLQLFLGT